MNELIAMAGGIMTGTLAGLLPGIHPNLVASLIVALPFLPGREMSFFLLATAIANAFTSSIPAIFVGAPDAENALGLHPFHKYLHKGRGHEAVLMTLIGSVSAAILTLMMIPVISTILQNYRSMQSAIPYALMIIAGSFIVQEKKKVMALVVFLLSGAIGYVALNSSMNEPLLPLFSGLFGLPALCDALNAKSTNPPQQVTQPKVKAKDFLSISAKAQGVGIIFSILPALGPTQATAIVARKKTKMKHFIIMLGALSTISVVASAITFLEIGKSRDGIVKAIETISHKKAPFSEGELIATFLITLFPATAAAIGSSRIMKGVVNRIPHKKVTTIVLLTISGLIAVLSGWQGMLLAATATMIGFIPIRRGIRRSHLMGCLMIPTIVWYLKN